MSNYSYIAVDPSGLEISGNIEVSDQSEALRRIREMGLFPTKVFGTNERRSTSAKALLKRTPARKRLHVPGFGGRVRTATLTIFTRQLATLIEAGMPLLRGLRTLEEQEENQLLKRVIGELSLAIECGGSLAEAVGAHPRIFNRLYVNMIKAGELSGAMEVTLKRLAEFMEKAQKIKGKVKAAMFYPCAVLVVAAGIMTLLMVFVVPRFRQIFDGMLEGARMHAFTVFVLSVSEGIRTHLLIASMTAAGLGAGILMASHTLWGRWTLDRYKLRMPVLGPVFRKAAISRFARTLGTLVSSGVPILQALIIVKEMAGNAIIGDVISTVHEKVKEGDAIAPTLKASRIFPAMVAGMVDVGEQTGALPEMLMRIADNYDEEVDNAASAMTSILEPIMIVFLAVIVGSIVIAMFLPLLRVVDILGGQDGAGPRMD